MGTQCSLCFPFKASSRIEIDVFDETCSDNNEKAANNINHTMISEKKTPLNTMPIHEKHLENSIIIAQDGDLTNVIHRPKYGKEDFQILKVFIKKIRDFH